MDLFLDDKKTKTWSVSGLLAFGRNLGAHVQYIKQHTNKVLMDRAMSLATLWNKLRLASCGYALKVRALTCAAWPRGLYGVEATTLSLTAFHQLRISTMKGLRIDCSGANAHVQLDLVEPALVDPHCWAIMQTIRLHRNCGNQRVIEQLLATLAAGEMSLPTNTVTNTLLTRL